MSVYEGRTLSPGPLFDELAAELHAVVHGHVHVHRQLRRLLQARVHALGDDLAHAPNRHHLVLARGCGSSSSRSRCRRGRAARRCRLHVFLRDAPAGTRPSHRRQVHAERFRPLARERRGRRRGARRSRRGCGCRRLVGGAHVVLGHATARTGRRHGREVHAQLLRQPPRRRRCRHALALGSRRGGRRLGCCGCRCGLGRCRGRARASRGSAGEHIGDLLVGCVNPADDVARVDGGLGRHEVPHDAGGLRLDLHLDLLGLEPVEVLAQLHLAAVGDVPLGYGSLRHRHAELHHVNLGWHLIPRPVGVSVPLASRRPPRCCDTNPRTLRAPASRGRR